MTWMERALERALDCMEKRAGEMVKQICEELERNKKVMDMPVQDAGMSGRVINLLLRAGCNTIRDVWMMEPTELFARRGFGIIAMREICAKLQEIGLPAARLERFIAQAEIKPHRAKRIARKKMKEREGKQ